MIVRNFPPLQALAGGAESFRHGRSHNRHERQRVPESLSADVAESQIRDDGRLALTVGCEFGFDTPQTTTAVFQVAPALDPLLQIHREHWHTDAPHHGYTDVYGNRCERFTIAPGSSRLVYEAEVVCEKPHDTIEPEADEIPPTSLPDETINFIMPSRFCLPDELGSEAWDRFGALTPGWGRVQAVVDYVHELIEFDHEASNPWTTATDVFRARRGVCRDYAHLAISFCRALNIPTRYVFGYISDLGVQDPELPMDFAAWLEAYLDGEWHTFDPRNNTPRIGRVVVGRGRDAADVALVTSLGPMTLTAFEVKVEAVA